MRLFKYAPPERVDVLQRQRIRFTPPTEFNDPFEGLPDTSLVKGKGYLENMRIMIQTMVLLDPKNTLLSDKWEEEIERKADAQMRQDLSSWKRGMLHYSKMLYSSLRILSLSRVKPSDPSSLLLWGHYTSMHRGLVFEFDGNHEWFQRPLRLKRRRAANSCLLPAVGLVRYRVKRLRSSRNPGSSPVTLAFTKSRHWAYEKEFRYVDDVDNIIGINKHTGMFKFPPSSLLSVTLGMRVSDQTEEAVKKALGRPTMAHVKLRWAAVAADRYTVKVMDTIPSRMSATEVFRSINPMFYLPFDWKTGKMKPTRQALR